MKLKIEQIKASELNPNLMDDKKLEKLKKLIEKENNYPPLIVNKRDGEYRLVDGHQRLRVLKELKHTDIKVDVWEVSEEEELMLLATLNKLKGTSIVQKKEKLYKKLSEFLDKDKIKELSPESEDFFNKLFEQKKKVLRKNSIELKMNKSLKVTVMQVLTKDQFKIVDEYISKNYTGESREKAIYYMVKELNKLKGTAQIEEEQAV